MDISLSLLTPYRDRLPHLTTQLAWWKQYPQELKKSLDWIIVEVTPAPSPGLAELLQQHQITYLHLACTGPFHKTKALNLALNQAQGELVAAFDVDLIPLGQTLTRHSQLAAQSSLFLVTGYRLMASQVTVDPADLQSVLADAAIGPEDQPTALRKHLLDGERFGVMPLFRRDRLLQIAGWDETFIGWGAEDQELIERYLTAGQTLCRCPDLTYVHLHHGSAEHWNSPLLTAQNRTHYYSLQQTRNTLNQSATGNAPYPAPRV